MNQRSDHNARIDLNHVRREELVELPFIDERLAETIIHYRVNGRLSQL